MGKEGPTGRGTSASGRMAGGRAGIPPNMPRKPAGHLLEYFRQGQAETKENLKWAVEAVKVIDPVKSKKYTAGQWINV